MLRAPICRMSAYVLTSGTISGAITSVTTGRPVSSRAAANSFSPSVPSPWKLYGEVRGLKAPPRKAFAPAPFTAWAASRIWSRSSTAHGPAITTSSFPPTDTPFIFTMVS